MFLISIYGIIQKRGQNQLAQACPALVSQATMMIAGDRARVESLGMRLARPNQLFSVFPTHGPVFKMAVSRAGGYEHVFLEQSSKLKDFECPLCLHVTREPSLTSCCGQHFCQSCINRITSTRKPCPFCTERNFTVLLDKKQRRRVMELKVYCTMKEQGCTWTGDLGDLEAHIDSGLQKSDGCQYINVICSNKCGKGIQRRYLPVHLSEQCPNRVFTCEFCDYLNTYSNITNEHYRKCIKYPLLCPNKCGIGKVERGMMKKHLNECSQQIVDCEFAHTGCTKLKICRKDLQTHVEQSMQSHLSMMSLKMQELGEEVKFLMTRLDKKDEEVRMLTARVDQKDQDMKVLKMELRQKDEEIRQLNTKLVAMKSEARPRVSRPGARYGWGTGGY